MPSARQESHAIDLALRVELAAWEAFQTGLGPAEIDDIIRAARERFLAQAAEALGRIDARTLCR